MKSSEKIDQLQASLKEFQATHQKVGFDSSNPLFHSKYASLGKCREVADLHNYHLAIVQGGVEIGAGVTTRLIHDSGQWIETVMTTEVAPTKISKDGKWAATPQGAGIAMTYCRRYALCAILGLVADEDDDGNGSFDNPPPQRQQTNYNPPPQRQAPRPQRSGGGTPITFGKHKGSTLEEVAQTDRGYVEWIAKNARDDSMKLAALAVLGSGSQGPEQSPFDDLPPEDDVPW